MNLFSQFIQTEFDGVQAKAAEALDIDRSMVSRIVRGERQVSPALAQRISEVSKGKYRREDFIWPEESARNAA